MGLDVGCDAAARVADPGWLNGQVTNTVHCLDTPARISMGEAS